MQIDPHTLQQILQRIEKQMRCPQCGKQVPVDFASVQVMADDAMLLQLHCDNCSAFIVLHASLQGVEHLETAHTFDNKTVNSSSTMEVSKEEMQTLQAALQQAGGSFEALFEQANKKDSSS